MAFGLLGARTLAGAILDSYAVAVPVPRHRSLTSTSMLCLGLVLGACASASSQPRLGGTTLEEERIVDGREREWIVYLPSDLNEPAPIVFALAGSTQTAAELRELTRWRLDELADRFGVILIYAHGWKDGSRAGPDWNGCRAKTTNRAHRENVDDVGFLLGLLDDASRRWPIDPARVYILGVSDGGQMTYRMATEHPERFAAAAVLIAQQPVPEDSSCNHPRGPIPILMMNGTEDPIIPFDGGTLGFWWMPAPMRALSMQRTAEHWRRVNGIRDEPKSTRLADKAPDDDSTVSRALWQGSEGNDVLVYAIEGGGHAVPGAAASRLAEFFLGPTNRDIVAMDEIWHFFAAHRR